MSQSPIPTTSTSDDRLGRLIDVVGQLAQQQKSLLESLRASPPAPSSGTLSPVAPGTAPSPLGSTADIRAFVADMFRQHSTAAAQTATRDGYIKQYLADLPEAYRRLMPDTADAAALADAEQKIRRQFRDDLRSVRQGGRVATFRFRTPGSIHAPTLPATTSADSRPPPRSTTTSSRRCSRSRWG